MNYIEGSYPGGVSACPESGRGKEIKVEIYDG